VFACVQSDYTKLVKQELASGIRKDSLLFGIRFGDTRNDFFGKCFDLNKQRLVTQGPNSSSVQYMFSDSLYHKRPTEIRMLFYPSFDSKDVINEMIMEFNYSGWAPWNRPLQSDSLKVKTMELLMKWYGGNNFITANVDKSSFPVKLDGNRRILVEIKDVQSVVVKVQDILHPQFMHSITKRDIDKQ
jgi:hypothetical protein